MQTLADSGPTDKVHGSTLLLFTLLISAWLQPHDPLELQLLRVEEVRPRVVPLAPTAPPQTICAGCVKVAGIVLPTASLIVPS